MPIDAVNVRIASWITACPSTTHTQLTRFVVRGPWVLLAMLTAIRKLLIPLIWYHTLWKVCGSRVRNPTSL